MVKGYCCHHVISKLYIWVGVTTVHIFVTEYTVIVTILFQERIEPEKVLPARCSPGYLQLQY